MGQHAEHTNAFASVLLRGSKNPDTEEKSLQGRLCGLMDQINDAFKKAKIACRIDYVQGDGTDVADILVLFTEYTQCTLNGLYGDVTGEPTAAEIAAAKAVCDSFSVPWSEPERTERLYVY